MSHIASAAGGGVPDHPTAGRWCKGCCDFLPLDNFPKGKRRYMCSKHARPSNARAIREKMFGKNPRKKAVWRIWHYAYLDSRSSFPVKGGVDKTRSLTQADIAAQCEAQGLEPTTEVRVVPLDPRAPAKPGNMALVGREQRPLLVKVWKACQDLGMYCKALERARSGAVANSLQ